MSRTLPLAIVAVLVSGSALRADTWQIDPAHTTVQFAIRHMTVSNVRGEFPAVAGTVQVDGGTIPTAKIDVTIDAASINTHEPKRDEDVRSADFLDVARYPKITFRSTEIKAAGKEQWKVTGDLTLHGVTRSVVLDVQGPTGEVKDPQGVTRAGAHATTQLDRKDFGITWSKLLDGGGLVVGNEIWVTIDVEGIKKP